MKIKEFNYIKKDSPDIKKYKVLVMSSDDKSIWGLSLDALTPDEQKSLLAIQEEYEAKIEPFKKALRNFKLENIVPEGEKND